ncbi:MAG: hypothetical protein ACUVTZ_07375 [Armatimonadota bacterium]
MENNRVISADESRRAAAVRLLIGASLYLLLFYLSLFLHKLPGADAAMRQPLVFVPTVLISVAAFMFAQLLLVRRVAELQLRAAVLVLGTLVCLILWAVIPLTSKVIRPEVAMYAFIPWRNMMMILAATLFGCLVSYAIREPGILAPGSLVAAMVDYWGVYYGTTLHAVQTAPKVVEKVSVKVPAFGVMGPIATIGPGDFVFLGVFFAAMHRLRLRVRETFWVLLILLAPCLAAVLAMGWSIPALVPMAVAVLLVNRGRFGLTRSEKVASAVAVALVAALLVLLTAVGPFAKAGSAPITQQEKKETPAQSVSPSRVRQPAPGGTSTETRP